MCKNVVNFFLLCRGVETWLRIFTKQLNLKKIKNGHFSFFVTFETTTHCNFKFWKIDPPYCTLYRTCLRDFLLLLFYRKTSDRISFIKFCKKSPLCTNERAKKFDMLSLETRYSPESKKSIKTRSQTKKFTTVINKLKTKKKFKT